MTVFVVGVAAAVVIAAIWWRFFRIARPDYPPLSLPDDDPLMVQARNQARDTLSEFRAMYASPHQEARLKVPFTTSAGVREYIWSEVRSLTDTEAEVAYLTPPVTHTGRLDRIHVHPLSEIVDWQITLTDGEYRGGYTMLVMFRRAREQWGELPPDLAHEEQRYRKGA